MSQFTMLDYIVLVVYILGIAWFGARFGKKQNTTKDYFLGGRSIPWWAIGLSVMATQASAITFIGAPGWGYEGGLERINTFINVPLAMAFLIATIVPFFYRAEVYTAYEYLERRFGAGTRTLSAALFLVARGLATGVVLYAPALVLSVVTGWDIKLTIILMAVIAVSYTVLGGISAVIWTDVIQMFVLWLGAAISIVVILVKVPGGMSSILGSASDAGMLESLNFSFDLSVEYSVWAGVIGGFFLHAAYFGTDQSQIQRVLTSKSIRESKLSLVLSGVLLIPQMLLFLFIGILLFAFYQTFGDPNIDNLNELFPLFVVNQLPAGISGLIIAGVFAAAMSSLDSALNSLSAVSIRDFYGQFVKKNASDEHYLKASRWATIFWGIYATIFAFFAANLGPVIEAVNKIGSYFYGALLGVFILAIFTKRTNGVGAVTGIIAGMLSVWGVTQFAEVSWLYNNFVGAIVSVGVGYVVSLIGAKPKAEKLAGLTLFDLDDDIQEVLKARSEAATSLSDEEIEEERRTSRWPLYLIGYFVVVMIGLYLIGLI
ncbi:sodium:solute symporter [Pseudalkalibacillus hwajinpoensis]|uniref:sodium:solute symporter n=1 Tax=Guptibacillus hwajinpoensis TaxID=208199 RepID=UPI001CD5CD8E|nr:sodium:solute symporter [Pseudalkalibacillus hwajinpoensis]MCA0991578.1 sodium:solute symporter [Pseudalkalibacillus hwajinpoensis]